MSKLIKIQRLEKSTCKLPDCYTQIEFSRIPPPNQFLVDSKKQLKTTENEKILSTRLHPLNYLDVFFKCCIVLDRKTVHNSNKFRQK